ncbi:hypothetical protein TTHERM_00249600 (macronuclear) [Tetrahymena thermophila SB210]|uniref:Uncharacterized protein n=1 Tax=Tetrahymena thermophila (strain SB210) TaxID=312017 RepID=Q23QX3_TETTS|nr:hypothetical protein TTHERM_00249600 [Tetrahymena thermophila SB210]EAR98765.4 hypothetical protein TTHERM_00249600 [Tetrahymena thermophila SB210]|eukprot:XP_001019010.4 hypothetical protein TTHERM_00249600 [Tetrahymena thermophila SB210]
MRLEINFSDDKFQLIQLIEINLKKSKKVSVKKMEGNTKQKVKYFQISYPLSQQDIRYYPINQEKDKEFLENTNTFYRYQFEKISENREQYHLFQDFIFDTKEIEHNTCLLLGTEFTSYLAKIIEQLGFDRRYSNMKLEDFRYYQAKARKPRESSNQEKTVAQQCENLELRIIKTKEQNKQNLAKNNIDFILLHFLSREELKKMEKKNNDKEKNKNEQNENKLTNYFRQKQKINQIIDQKPFPCDSNTTVQNEIYNNQILQQQLPQQIGQQEPQHQSEIYIKNQQIDQTSISHDFNTVKLNEIQNKQIQQLPQEINQHVQLSFSGLIKNQGLKQNEQNKLVENNIENQNQQTKLSDLEIQYKKKFQQEIIFDQSHQLEDEIKALKSDLQKSQIQSQQLFEENEKISANANDDKLFDIIQKKNNQQDFCQIQQQLNIQNQNNSQFNNFNSDNYNQFINRANQINQEQSQYNQQSNCNFNYYQSLEKQIKDLKYQVCKIQLENAQQKMKMFFTLYPDYIPEQNLSQQNNLYYK